MLRSILLIVVIVGDSYEQEVKHFSIEERFL